jgi:hypothetical protein
LTHVVGENGRQAARKGDAWEERRCLSTAAQRRERSYSHSPRFAGRTIAPRQREREKVAKSLRACALQQDQLATPRVSEIAVTMPVECDAYDASVQMVFGGDGSEMSGVVLNAQHRQSHGLGEQGRAIIGMTIADDEFR